VRGGTSPTWSFQDYVKASNAGASDQFGSSLAVSGHTMVVGAPFEDSNATGVDGDQSNNSAGNSGAAYIFVFCGAAADPIQLVIAAQGTDFKLTWPVTCTTDTLEETTDLTNPASWATAGVTSTNSGIQYDA